MVDLVGPSQVVQVGPQPVEVAFALVAQGIRDPRRLVRDRAAGLLLAVQQPERVLLVAARAVAADPVQAVRVPGTELFHVSRAAHRASRAIHLEGQVLDADRFVDLPGDLHDLEIDGRVLAAQHFHVDLVELAVPARLGTLVPEGGADGEEPQGLGPAVQLALGVGPADPGGELGTQGSCAPRCGRGRCTSPSRRCRWIRRRSARRGRSARRPARRSARSRRVRRPGAWSRSRGASGPGLRGGCRRCLSVPCSS